ncbi:MAG: RNA polymerase sigma factor [Deltaproteobacteria bacterium]|nr:RNA polymerase sigma factor [Deltaproteobacteria bacterium]
MTGKLLLLRSVEGVREEMSDEALLAACGAGDAAALGALFDRHHASVYRFLSRLAGTDSASLDDLVQTTFLEVRRGARRFGGRAAVRSWIFGVAANVVRHQVRGEIRRKSILQACASLPALAGTTPHQALERRELVERLGAALRTLSHDLRAAFVLCELEEVPGIEAARVLGVREGTLWRRLHEARRALRAAIDGEPE